MSPRTANKHSTPVDEASDNAVATHGTEGSMQTPAVISLTDVSTQDSHASASELMSVDDNPQPASEITVLTPGDPTDGCTISVGLPDAADDVDRVPTPDVSLACSAQTDVGETATLASSEVGDQVVLDAADQSPAPAGTADTEAGPASGVSVDDAQHNVPDVADHEAESDIAEDDPSVPRPPDPTTISDRLRNLVVAVGQVEELSRRAREVAASDLALYNGIAASQQQFEEGLAEARRIGQEAQAVYQRAFGREAKALAEPAVAEAREVEQAFTELAQAWRHQAETFLAEHPDVETLIAEERQHGEEARRREAARARAERFQQLVTGFDAALRQGLLDDARDCLKMLGREFPAEAERVAPLHDRLDHRVRATNDAAARRVLVQASELQGRGEFDTAVRLLEAVEVQGLSREASEDVFGRWSAACSLLGQTGGLELLRYSPAQGRGVIIHRDPSVPYGMVVFSALGMGQGYFEGRVVSTADREGAAIIGRARPFRAAELPAELGVGWYGRSYVTSGSTAAQPVRH